MIYITGDTHIPIDIKKLNNANFPQQVNLTKNDYVIICGDFGGVWDNSKEELYWRDWLNKKNFTTLFIDGNHENFDLLSQYEVKEWHNGKVHFVSDNIIHLMRGQVFEIEGNKFFTMGGAESYDKCRRVEGISWWNEELPSNEEYNIALETLDKNNWCIDYIITHDCSQITKDELFKYLIYKDTIKNSMHKFFDIIEEKATFKHWYFGHYHDDGELDSKHTVLYNEIIKIN